MIRADNESRTNPYYLASVVFMMTLGVAATLIIFIYRPDKDNASLVATIMGLIVPTTISLLALMKADATQVVDLDTQKRVARLEGMLGANPSALHDSVSFTGAGRTNS